MPGKKAVILGEMKEVKDAVDRHLDVGRWLKEVGFDQVILIGRYMMAANMLVEGSFRFETVAMAKAFLETRSLADHTVLIKASRSMGLDQVMESLH